MVFDRIVIVDWSANAAPKRGADSIWICTLDTASGAVTVANHPTRTSAFDALTVAADSPGRVLVGVDFPLGYPTGCAAALGVRGNPWSAIWEFLSADLIDDRRNRNNRWTVAAEMNRRLGVNHFWGTPPSAASEHLTPTRPEWTERHLPTYRATEQRLRDRGLRPFSAWQLLGAGSVGSQAITGIPAMQRLRLHPRLAGRVRVWPFETGLQLPDDDGIVVAEVWPSSIPFEHVDHPVKDARQVVALAQWFASHSAADATPASDIAGATALEEGWVLGPQ